MTCLTCAVAEARSIHQDAVLWQQYETQRRPWGARDTGMSSAWTAYVTKRRIQLQELARVLDNHPRPIPEGF